MSIESDIRQRALETGFDAAGITTAEPVDPIQVDFYRRWLESGSAAGMGYLHRHVDKRFAPAQLLPGAKSVICVALNYRHECTQSVPLPNHKETGKPEARPALKIAQFAQHEDYHPFIKKRLFQLAEYISKAGCAHAAKFKVCVDSVPLAERALAQRAGLGFIGKNHMLIHPEFGNQLLLGELITTIELTPDTPLTNRSCGDCGRCIRACPTGALDSNGGFDARKCISYLTIEDRDYGFVIPASEQCHSRHQSAAETNATISGRRVKPGMTTKLDHAHMDFKNYIFGCDECILACPYEINAPPRKNTDLQFHPEWQNLTSRQIFDMTEEEFARIFAGSSFLRLGLNHFKHLLATRPD